MRSRAIFVMVGMALLGGATAAVAETDGWVTGGTSWWSQSANEAKFQEFREVPQGAFLESFLLRQWSARSAFILSGANAIRRDQAYGITLAHGARVRLDAGYQQVPHLFSQVARLGYEEVAPGVFLLPDSLQSRNQNNAGAYNATMTDFLNSSAADARLAFRTDISNARFRVRPAQGWQFDVRATRRERSGRKALGGTFGFSNAVEIIEPLDQRTLDVDGLANWSGKKVSVRTGIGVSSFDNAIDALVWDNPRRLTDASNASRQGRLALSPGNWALRGRIGMNWRIQSRTTLNTETTVSRRSQDEDFLPFTINSALPQSSLDSLPARSLGGEAVDWMQDVRLHSRLMPKLSGTLRFRHHRYENKTPELSFIGRSAYDQSWTAGPFHNHPFGNQQTTWGADVDWGALPRVKLGAMAEMRHREHTFREGEKDEEPRFEVSASAQPIAELSVRSFYGYGHRYLTHFVLEDYENNAGVFIEQPGLRRFDVANRKRHRAGTEIDAALSNHLDVGVEYAFERDHYDESVYGLQEWKQHSALAQAVLRTSDRFNLSGGYGVAWPRTRQASNETGTAPPPTADAATDWWAVIRDRSEWAFTGADWWALPKKLNVGVSYTYSRDQTEYDLTNGAGTAQDLPNTFYRRHLVAAEAKWLPKFHTDLAVRYGYDYFDVRDFANQNVPFLGPTATAGTAIYLGDNVRPYVANQVALVYTRRF